MLSPMIVRLPAVAVAGAVGLPMAVAMVEVEAEPPLQYAPTRAMVMGVLALQHRLLFVPLQPQLLWRRCLLNRWLKRQPRLPQSRKCL